MGKRVPIPIPMGGMYAAGDLGTIPDGSVPELLNILPRPNRYPSRPPVAYDSLMNINGLANFDDATNKVARLVAIDTAHHPYEKSTSGETWSSSLGTLTGTRLTSYANYRGKLYGMMDDGSGLPSSAFSFDGANLSTSPFNAAIQGRTIDVFNDRLYVSYPRLTVTPQVFTGKTLNQTVYDVTAWTKSGCTVSNITANGVTISRVFVTSTTAGLVAQPGIGSTGVLSYASTADVRKGTWLCYLRGTHASYRAPITMELVLNTQWVSGNAYVVGDLISDGTSLQRCTTDGTAGGVAPAWATTVGATTADGAGTLVWTNEGSRVLASLKDTIPTATESLDFTAFALVVTVPLATNTLLIAPILRFYSADNPTVTLSAVDMSLKDSITDGDPRKANRGQQFTLGSMIPPFFNCESASSATVDLAEEIWSELGDPRNFKRTNTYAYQEAVGYPTASCVIGGRKITWKRNAFWVFAGTDSADIPIRRERPINFGIGCLGPLAHDEYENETFFIGESDIYRMKVGDDQPSAIGGDGMRETIMARGSNWVESQSTYKRPLLRIDKSRLIVWVYTQKGKLYAYDLRLNVWSSHTLACGKEIDTMLWNQNTSNFYVAIGGFGLTRMDYATGDSTGAYDTIDNTATTYSGTMSVTLRPIELYDPPHYEATLEEVRDRESITISGQQVNCSYSQNQGRTFTDLTPITVTTTTTGEFGPMRFFPWVTGGSITVKMSCVGKLGEAAFSLSKRIYAMLNVRRGEYIKSNS